MNDLLHLMFLKNCFAILTFTSNKRFLENVFVNWQIITFAQTILVTATALVPSEQEMTRILGTSGESAYSNTTQQYNTVFLFSGWILELEIECWFGIYEGPLGTSPRLSPGPAWRGHTAPFPLIPSCILYTFGIFLTELE